MEKFYKLARPDGWDIYTGNTINYRDNIGKVVRRPSRGGVMLCSSTALHASRKPNQCFIGSRIPCSAYLVSGKPYAEDGDKCGFKQLLIIKELKPEKLFKWNYTEACNPVRPFRIEPPKKITKQHLNLLKQWALAWDWVWDSVGDSVWDSVWDSVGDSVWDSVGDSVWDSVGDSVGDSVWDSVGDSVGASVGAYVGFIFKDVVSDWKYISHKKGEYPFQSTVDLWKMGLVPSFDGKKWRLHGGEKAETLWEGTL